MENMQVIIVCALFIAALFLYWVLGRYKSKPKVIGIDGKMVWIDRGRKTKAFTNKRYGVFGKPDFIYRTGSGEIAVEYKSRIGRVYDSDIAQSMAAALAARGEGRNIVGVCIQTELEQKRFELPSDDQELFRKISTYVEMARRAKCGGVVPPSPHKAKCMSCSYTESCAHAL